MKNILLSGLAVATICATAANAADLAYPTKAPSPAPSFSWTGCYVGGSVGAGSGHATWRDDHIITPTPANGQAVFDNGPMNDGATQFRVANTDQSGQVYGGQVGCDYQLSHDWLVGVEGAFSGSNISGTDQDQFNANWTLRNQVSSLGSVTGRMGFLATENVVLYARGGVAFAHNNLTITDAANQFTGPTRVDRVGFMVAPGIEWRFTPKASVFVQGEHYEFNSKVLNGLVDPNMGAPQPANARIGLKNDILRIGANYRF